MFFNNRDDRREQTVNKNGYYRLTQSGETRVAEFGYGNSPRDRLLVALECAGSSATIDEISRFGHISKSQVERLLPALIRSGLVADGSGGLGGGE